MSKSTSTDLAKMRCPTCRESFARSEMSAWPFCSSRCQMVDLGRWMKEDYRIPDRGNVEDLEEAINHQANGQPDPSDSPESSDEF